MARRASTTRRRKDRLHNSSTTGFGRGRNRDSKLPVWMRLLFKFLAYGAVMLFLKYSQQKKARSDNIEDEEGQMPKKRKKMAVRTFTAGNGAEVYVVKNFLPQDVATKWRDAMSDEWRKQMDDKNTEEELSPSPSWTYATNNDGSFNKDFNRKYRSLDNISNRNKTARQMYQSGMFSYAKWELDRSHSLFTDIEETFVSDEIRNRVQRIINKYAGKEGSNQQVVLEDEFSDQLADLFITHYWTGDFLSAHNGGSLGTWAFVLSLMEGPDDDDDDNQQQWEQDFGGILRFTCPTKPGMSDLSYGGFRWCETVRPSFNTAVFFRSRPHGPHHEVLPVSWRAEEEGFHRFAVTGWYMDPKDIMSDYDRAILKKARGMDTDTAEDEF